MELTTQQFERRSDHDLFEPSSEFRFTDNELLVEVFQEEHWFEDLAKYWKELAERADTTICMTYEWSSTWWKHFGRNKKRSLFIITVWEGTKIVALAPFYKGYSSIASYPIERRMQLIGSGGSPSEQFGYMDDYGISDFLDIIVDPDYYQQVASTFVQIIKSGFLDTDVLSFHQARDDSFILNYIYPRLKETDLNIDLQKTDTCPYIDLREEESMKEYIKGQKSNARRRIRKTIRATGEGKEFEIVEPQSWHEIEEATENIITLHQNRWNELGFPGVFHDDRFTRFFKDIVKYAYHNNWLWFKEARDKEGVCASRMLLRYQNRYYDYISGFDDNRESAKYRPGISLLIEVVKDGIAANASTVELLRGEEEYKYDFTSTNFNNWKLTINYTQDVKKMPRFTTDILALLYKYIIRESRLMNIQRQTGGFLNMIPGYLSFRWKSIQLKLKDK